MPQEVSAELRRLVERWRQLPLTDAESRLPLVRRLIDDLAAETAPQAGPVPDLGPAAVPDQLAVLVHDRCDSTDPGDLGRRLALLRSQL